MPSWLGAGVGSCDSSRTIYRNKIRRLREGCIRRGVCVGVRPISIVGRNTTPIGIVLFIGGGVQLWDTRPLDGGLDDDVLIPLPDQGNLGLLFHIIHRVMRWPTHTVGCNH